MVYRPFLERILKMDTRIRYVGVFADAVLYDMKREGLKPLLDNKETEKSLQDAVMRFRQRKLLAPKIGNVIYAFAKYEKINRIAIPLDKDRLLLVSTESDVNPSEIADKIVEKKREYNI